MQDFKKLQVWQHGFQLTLKIYEYTKGFPKEEIYGLTSQMRRSSSSIISNIAEGAGKDSSKEFNRFLQIAMGSSSELECQLLLAKELFPSANAEKQIELYDQLMIVRKMLNSLIQKVKTTI